MGEPTRGYGDARLVAPVEINYTRHPAAHLSTPRLLASALHACVSEAGLSVGRIDGLAVSSFTLRPDTAIDLAWRCGLSLRWLEQDSTGGASAVAMVQKAARAVEAGDAEAIVVLAGDVLSKQAFTDLVRSYNLATAEHLTPLPAVGPNAQFALLTQRQMVALGLEREDYAGIVLSQRSHAAANPGAVYRQPLSLADYLGAPVVAPPLVRYDCVPPVTGANAVLVTSSKIARGPSVRVRAIELVHNADHQLGSGLTTGLSSRADRLWAAAGCGPADVEVVSAYDDYPAMVVAQLLDLGVWQATNLHRQLAALTEAAPWLNTSGGQLSAGQAGTAGGLHGLVEVCRQLTGARRTVESPPRLGLVAGYGMVAYRYGACAGAAVLEAA